MMLIYQAVLILLATVSAHPFADCDDAKKNPPSRHSRVRPFHTSQDRNGDASQPVSVQEAVASNAASSTVSAQLPSISATRRSTAAFSSPSIATLTASKRSTSTSQALATSGLPPTVTSHTSDKGTESQLDASTKTSTKSTLLAEDTTVVFATSSSSTVTTSSSKLVGTSSAVAPSAPASTTFSPVSENVQLTLQQFGLLHKDGSTTYNHIKLSWPAIPGASSYDVLRSSNGATFAKALTASGSLVDDYDLPPGDTFFYNIQARSAQGSVIKDSGVSNVTLSPAPLAANIEEVSNYFNSTVFSSTVSPTKRADSYSFSIGRDSTNNNQPMIVQRSSSGVTTTVLSSKTLCGPTGGSCRLEGVRFVDNPATGEAVLWAHYEGASGYGEARVVVAWGKPGNQWTFGGAFRPTGRDSRDITFFTDAQGAAYIISATSMNSDLAIYKLTSDWHNVDSLAALVNVGQHREAPAILYRDGWYYLFSSHTAGWLPSDAGVIVAREINGEWSALANPASIATFGAQSGWVSGFGSTSLMNAPRWAAYWPVPQEYRQLLLPISVSGGYASYHFYKSVQLDSLNKVALGVQSGRLSSLGAPCKSSGGSGEALANDGKSNNGTALFKPTQVPFWYEVDLGDQLAIEQVDLTTPLVGGSEMYYSFQITASTDGIAYKTISDQSGNKNIGFTSFLVNGKPTARYVRINVQKVTNIQSGANGDWNAGIHELSVYTQ